MVARYSGERIPSSSPADIGLAKIMPRAVRRVQKSFEHSAR